MRKDFESDDFLAKWANDTLSAADKDRFEKSEEFKYYKSILEGTDVLEVPEYDKQKLFDTITKNKAAAGKVVPLFPKWAIGIAASLVILMGLWFAFDGSVTKHQTDFGEQLTLKLPDNSEVILNAKSSVTYNKKEWGNNRSLSLKGQAYFKVKKGSSFQVNTSSGVVKVLGTKFSVQDDGDIFEVLCFEGKVRVTKDNLDKTLTAGDAVRVLDIDWETWYISDKNPAWLQSRSVFKNAPLKQVLTAIERQYGKTINATDIDINKRFTGSFTHDNLEIALRTVCESMEIEYLLKDDKIILLVSK